MAVSAAAVILLKLLKCIFCTLVLHWLWQSYFGPFQ